MSVPAKRKRWLERVSKGDPVDVAAHKIGTEFADRVRLELAEQGLEQKELALRMGASGQNVTRMLNGGKNYRLTTLIGAAYHLGYDVEVKLVPRGE
jgi:ribosome-binding protein aMBF1 (putative translation factor)